VDRREFLAATAVAAVSPLPHRNTLSQSAPRQYFELRRYHLLPGTKQRAFSAFIGDAAIPAMI
jgi:2-polyprenyl-6-methoxyphenol hydroxylase-like FAD-dependent oxidoreductase